jgi:hypothetical protein
VYPNRNSFGDFSAGFQQNGGRVATNQTHNPTFILFYFTSHSYIEYTFGAQLLMVLKLDGSESRAEIPGKFRNVMLEKGGEDHLEGSCEKRNITKCKKERNMYL